MSILESKGLESTIISDSKMPFSVDLLVKNPESGLTWYNDPEVKSYWKEYELPSYLTNEGIHIAGRKSKLIDKKFDHPVTLTTVNMDLSRTATISTKKLSGAEVDSPNKYGVSKILKINKYSGGKEEEFYQVPIGIMRLEDTPEEYYNTLVEINRRLTKLAMFFKGIESDPGIAKLLRTIAQDISNFMALHTSFKHRIKTVLNYISNKENKTKWFEMAKTVMESN